MAKTQGFENRAAQEEACKALTAGFFHKTRGLICQTDDVKTTCCVGNSSAKRAHRRQANFRLSDGVFK